MTITTASTDDKKILYKLIHERNRKPMKQAPEKLHISEYAIFEDLNIATGEVVRLATIASADGVLFTTNSRTFIDDFAAIVEAFPDVNAVKVEKMISKKNREFLVCSMV